VIVNGVRFDDSAATITMNGAAATRDRLRVGMVVQVRGRIHGDGTGVAESIQYDRCVQGPITAMNRVQNTVTVLGQTVEVDDDTVFDGVTLRDMNAFAIGDQVEISCYPDQARNRLRATRMERQGTFQNGASDVVVKGTVSNLTAGTCTVDGLTVNFAAMAPADRPAGLANGMAVEARGRQFANGVLTADLLRDRDRDRISRPDGDGLEVEGYVADFVSIANFKIDGQAVNAANAVIRNGTAADVANGAKVEAEGTMSNGVLVASVVVLKLQTQVRVEAGMQAKSGTQGTGTITLLGRAFKVNADTELRDRLASRNQPRVVTLDVLTTDDRLEVKAYQDASGNLVAARVERTEADELVVVKGPVSVKPSITDLNLKLFGIEVTTGTATRYRDASGTLVDAATFYGAVQLLPVPSTVHARGVVAGPMSNIVDATRTASTIGELEIGEH